ncbi:TRAP transporter substrate-binding protein DctP [Virgibacillus sp. NKC19-3]|uniref:TRAP transporter substrate-binding protein DctP n=1 Tax=Virgibacillus saliphilus TaxID=2831674 RepID=UPI001C9B58D0|nr:TRAP transporter substrate-binding protein DctP [Virgibacillus sp. NKC19-3]MBY7142567.1 TRAP transporter substrate-binding protein DctP [Virgibacillus sp. NKC19-3]
MKIINKFIGTFVILFSFAFLSGCIETNVDTSANDDSARHPDAEVSLNLAHQWASPTDGDGDYRSLLAERFAEEVFEKTNGEVDIQVYPANSLVSPTDQFSSLQSGSIDMAIYPPFYDLGKVNEFSIGLMPGLIQTYDQAWEWDNAEIGKAYDHLLEKNGLKKLVSAWGIMGIGTKGDNSVIHPENVNGLVMRGAGREPEEFMEELGAGITSMDSSELYSALQTNVINGTLTSFDSFLSYSLYEVLDHFNYTGENGFLYASNPLVISVDTWENKLNEEQQKALEEVSQDLQGWVRESAEEANQEVVDIFNDNGVEVHVMSEEEAELWFDASQKIVDEFANSSEEAAQLVELAREIHE